MSHLKLTSANLESPLICPSSKSYAARALILAALSNREISLTNLPKASDTQDLIRNLKAIGLDIDQNEKENRLTIKNSFPACEKELGICKLNLGEGGTTIRFLLPVLALGRTTYEVSLAGRMSERPMGELYDALVDLGVKIQVENSKVQVQGPMIYSKSTTIDCTRSSQFASGFEMIKNFYPLQVTYSNLLLSKKYFEWTQHLISEIKSNSEVRVSVDFSCAGYFIAYAIFTKTINIKNIQKIDYFQADALLIDLLRSIGVTIETHPEVGMTVEKPSKTLRPLVLDGSHCIDLVPTLTFIAAHIPASSRISNIKGLVHKESDRLTETLRTLQAFGVEYSYNADLDELSIAGKKPEEYKSEGDYTFEPVADHRMVMIASLFVKLRGGGTVSNVESVGKSFPEFFTFFH